jgi:hypothetical protein
MDTVAVLLWSVVVPWSIITFVFWLVLRNGKRKQYAILKSLRDYRDKRRLHWLTHRTTSTETNRELEQDSYEDSQGDGLMSEDDLFFPEEPEPEDDS